MISHEVTSVSSHSASIGIAGGVWGHCLMALTIDDKATNDLYILLTSANNNV